MAIPISLTVKTADPVEEIRARLEQAPIDHSAAVLAAYQLLQDAQDQGLIDILRGLLGARDDIAIKLADAIKTTESVNAFRNLALLSKMVGEIDPAVLQRISRAAVPSAEEEPPSLWQIFKRLRTKESRRALAMGVSILQSLGSSASKDK